MPRKPPRSRVTKPGPAMLQQLGDRIKTCQERAEQCREAAASEIDERVHQQLLDLEQQWQLVAESYQFIESLDASCSTNALCRQRSRCCRRTSPRNRRGPIARALGAYSVHRLLCRDPRRVAYQYHCRSNVPRQFRSMGQRSPSASNVGAGRFPLCRLMSTW